MSLYGQELQRWTGARQPVRRAREQVGEAQGLARRIAEQLGQLAPRPEDLLSPSDRARMAELRERQKAARGRTEPLWKDRAYEQILPALLEMEEAIHGFFDRVMVNVDDLPTRVNRLRLLSDVRELFVRGWDLSRVVVAGET